MRKAFNHYLSIHEIKKQLNDKQYVLFDKALCEVQFLEVDIEKIKFNDPMLNMAWTSIKHTVNSNIEGYCSKMKINYKSLFYRHTDTPCQPPYEAPKQQEKGKGKGKEEEKGKVQLSNEKWVEDYFNKNTKLNLTSTLEWIDYKKSSYKTKASITKVCNFLSNYDLETQKKIIDTSIMNGWAGLFEPKNQKQNPLNIKDKVYADPTGEF